MLKINRSRSFFGITLVEVVISVLIFAIISGVIYLFFMVGIDSWEIGTRRTDLQAQARNAMDIMVGELKNTTRNHPSRGVTILPAPNNTNIIFYLPEKDADSDVIIDTDGTTKWPDDDADYIEYKYLAAANQLVREDRRVREGQDPARVLANDVSNIEFIDAGIVGSLYLDEVNIVLNLQKTTPRGRDLSFSMRSTVKLRN